MRDLTSNEMQFINGGDLGFASFVMLSSLGTALGICALFETSAVLSGGITLLCVSGMFALAYV